MLKRKFFGNNIAPSCKYCKFGRINNFDGTILCEKHGILKEADSCRKFAYDPLKRQPMKRKKLPQFNLEDFSL